MNSDGADSYEVPRLRVVTVCLMRGDEATLHTDHFHFSATNSCRDCCTSEETQSNKSHEVTHYYT